jgi:DNA processing protein
MTARRVLSPAERIAWLRLARTDTIGPATFAALRARFPDIREACEAAPRMARRGGSRELQIPDEASAKAELDRLDRLRGRIIACIEPDFPPGLAVLDPPPPVISVLGSVALLQREMVAVVGARNASGLGIKLAGMIAGDLGRAGFVVVSGMARGIDAAAHRAALDSGTIAVLAGGVDVVYPPEHQEIYGEIARHGVILSEMPIGMAPLPRHFPRRNRLISGSARGVVVIEAAERSGSLITAHYAVEQGREVFAVPGSPLDPRARGANRLIRDGAVLTESADDVLNAISPMLKQGFREPVQMELPPGRPDREVEVEADRVRSAVQEKLGAAPLEVDELIRQTGAPPEAVTTVLLELELAGTVQRHPGNRVSWR